LAALQQLAGQHPGAGIYTQLTGRVHADLMGANAEQRLWAEALAHADQAIGQNRDDPHRRYCRALLCLGAGDTASYRASCRAMVEDFQSASDPGVLKWVGWAATLGPGALDDYAELVEKLRRSALQLSGLDGPAYRFYLGGLLARAGRYTEAAEELEEVHRHLKEAGAYVDFSPAYCKSLLAICYAHLGQEEAARHWYELATMDVETLLPGKQGDADAANTVPWNRRLTLELLQKEAEAALSTLAPQPSSSG
jgi:tetratricopeptide (TPR) repeat protein